MNINPRENIHQAHTLASLYNSIYKLRETKIQYLPEVTLEVSRVLDSIKDHYIQGYIPLSELTEMHSMTYSVFFSLFNDYYKDLV